MKINYNLILVFTFILVFNEFTLGRLFASYGEIGNNQILLAIRLFNVYLALIGLYLYKKTKNILFKDSVKSIVLIGIGAFIFIEIMLRSIISIRYNFYVNSISDSEKLGWKTIENVKLISKPMGYDRKIEFLTEKYGFRKFGKTNTKKRKILIIGDSFTEGVNVNNDEVYYNYLDTNKYEIFAYGCGGYGTLQEFMIMDEYFDEINPDILLIQFCSNDIINNSYELERYNSKNNPHRIRPYLLNEDVEYLYPNMMNGALYRILDYFYIFRILKLQYLRFYKIEINEKNTNLDYLKDYYEKSERITLKILEIIKKRSNSIPLFSFTTDYNEYSKKSIESIFKQSGYTYIPNVPEQLISAKNKGMKIDGMPYDAHWNHIGHKIAGKYISEFLLLNDI